MKILGLFTTGNPIYDSIINLIILGCCVLIMIVVTQNITQEQTQRRLVTLKDRQLPTLDESITRYDQKYDSAVSIYNQAGLDGEDILADVGLRRSNCMVIPENGECPTDAFELVGDCCQLKAGENSGFNSLAMINEFALGYVAGEAAELVGKAFLTEGPEMLLNRLVREEGSDFVIDTAAKQMTRQSTGEVIEYGTKQTLEEVVEAITSKTLKELLEKAITKTLKKIIGKTLAKLVSKVLAFVARMMIWLSTGAGVFIALVEILMEVPDMFDFSGYNLYSSNQANLRLRNVCEYKYAKMLEDAGQQYPSLFDISQVYPEELKAAVSAAQAEYTVIATLKLLDIPGGVDELFSDSGETPIFEGVLSNLFTEEHKEISKLVFDILNKELPADRPYDIKYYENFSAPYKFAVSLTEESAMKWNEDHYQEWFDYLSGDKEYEEGVGPPLSVVYTDKYGVVDPTVVEQNDSNPTMIEKTLTGGKVPLGGFHYLVMKECLDRRSPMRMPREARRSGDGIMVDIASGLMELQYAGAASLTPSKFGVTFNHDTRTCKYTQRYCEHVGLKYNASGAAGTSDCRLWPGQYEAELIFGTSMTRAAIKFGNDPEKEMKDFFQETVINIWEDPDRWKQQYENLIIRTGDMAKNAALGIKQRAQNFASAFEDDPERAVLEAGIEYGNLARDVAEFSNPMTHAHTGCEQINDSAGRAACHAGVILIFPPASIMYGLSSLDKQFGITNALGLGGNNPYNPIFFQVDSEGNEVDSHEHKDVNDKRYIQPTTYALYFKYLTKDDKSDGDEYYVRIYDKYNNLVQDNIKPDPQTQYAVLSQYADGWHKIMLKH